LDAQKYFNSSFYFNYSYVHNNEVKKNSLVIFFGLFLGASSTTCYASSAPDTLSLPKAYEFALGYSLERQIQRQNVEITSEQYSQARGSVLPNVSLRARHFRQDSIEGQIFSDNQQTSLFLNASQPLLQGLREYTALGIAKERIERAESVVETFERQVLFDITRLYYSILMDQRELENIRQLMNLTRQRVNDLRQRVDIGRSRTSELILAQSQLVTVEAREKSLERNLARLWTEFELKTGLTNRPTLLDQTAPEIQLDTLGAFLSRIDSLPEMRRADLNFSLADREVELAHRYHYPDVTLDFNYYLKRDGIQRERDWDMSVNLRMPLFEGFRVQSQTREASMRRRQAVLERDHLRRQLEAEIRELHSTLEIDLGRIEITRRAVELARRNYDEQRREYNLGLVTNQEVLQALNAYIENQQTYDRLRLETAYNNVILKAKVGEDW
jgi:outer membrane protein